MTLNDAVPPPLVMVMLLGKENVPEEPVVMSTRAPPDSVLVGPLKV